MDLPELLENADKSSILKNRIRKNYRHIRKWAKRTETNCFRVYDRDIKEYPLAIDFYNGRFCVHHFASHLDSSEPFLEEVNSILCSLFGLDPRNIYWKKRIRRERLEQYEKLDKEEDFFEVLEYGVRFWINLKDYLDTGLFLDHRETRQLVAAQASGKKLLNLFAYTCSFSVHAAIQGASFTTSIDMSNSYTRWGIANFVVNNLSLKKNEVIRADVLQFLENPITELYDVIVIDPPTISRSKKMVGMFDVQKDHPALITSAKKLLAPGGILFFSTNSRQFKLDESIQAKEITNKTIPIDFHSKKIHRCWQI